MILIYTECGNIKETAKLAKILIKERLVACASWWPINSSYIWQGKIKSHSESALLLKTRKTLYLKVERRLKKLHSYKLPAIIVFSVSKSNLDYRRWLYKSTN